MESEQHPESPSERAAQPQQMMELTNFLQEEDSFRIDQEQKQSSNQYRLLVGTLWADICSNRKFFSRQSRVTLVLVIIILILKALPSPLIITAVTNDPLNLDHEPCLESSQECSSVGEGYETITIKKLNPLQRELKYFVRLNNEQIAEMGNYYSSGKINLNEEITWIEIYAVRNNEIYGDVIYQKDGNDIYEILFDDQALIFIGEVHILQEQSYLVKIYKLTQHVNQPKPRQLQPSSEQQRQEQLLKQKYENTKEEQKSAQNIVNSTDSSEHAINRTVNSTALEGNETQSTQQSNQTTSESQKNPNKVQNQTVVPPIIQPKNETEPTKKPNDTVPEPPQKKIQISVPLTVQMVRYSQFYTVAELAIRYITFLYILYVRSQTATSPFIFHLILILVSNPIMFIEIAFPNLVSNTLSNIFGSTQIVYLGVFLYYTHRRLKHQTAEVIFVIVKGLVFVGLWIATVLRQMHLVNQTKIQMLQYILMALVLFSLAQYLWRLFFFKINTILHRNVLFIALTVYYVLFLFFSGYIVSYGWKKISFYLIVQTYGIELCYLTTSYDKQNNDPVVPTDDIHPLAGTEQVVPGPSEEIICSSELNSQEEDHPAYVQVDSH